MESTRTGRGGVMLLIMALAFLNFVLGMLVFKLPVPIMGFYGAIAGFISGFLLPKLIDRYARRTSKH